MTPEEYAAAVLARITMQPQRSWDANVVEWETKSMESADFATLLADAIRHAVAAEREACIAAMEEAISGREDDYGWSPGGVTHYLIAAIRAKRAP